MLFALVANRALAPSSKLAAARWASGDVLITGLPATSDDACYRAMDWLLEIRDELEKQVFDNLADLLNLEVDLLFFDYPANRRLVRLTARIMRSISAIVVGLGGAPAVVIRTGRGSGPATPAVRMLVRVNGSGGKDRRHGHGQTA